MNRKMLGSAVVGMAVVAGGLVFSLSSQAAATIALPAPGTICVKLAKMGHTFFPWQVPTGVFAPTAGSITAQVGQRVTTSDGRVGFAFAVRDFVSTGKVTGLGDVSITLDGSRQPSQSTFIPNSTSGQGGSTQRINFYANVDVDGVAYHSDKQVTLLSTAVAAFPPPEGTVYTMASDVVLLDASGRPAFTLPAGKAATITR